MSELGRHLCGAIITITYTVFREHTSHEKSLDPRVFVGVGRLL